ncbi:MAG: NifB/NifX family molybdenum-iron cluster-binding protein [Hyphomonas sp.]
MKVAVTSQNFRTVTAHAGKARRFLIYDVQPGEPPRETGRLDLPKDMSLHAYHGEAPHPIEAVDAVVTGGCGEGFHRRMQRMGLGLVVTEESDPVTAAGLALAL